MSIVRFATGPKRSMGHVLGAKNSFAVLRPTTPQAGRAGLILSIPVKQVSLGSPRVGTIHVQAPTPHAPALQAFLADFSQQTTRFSHLLAKVCFQGCPRALDCRIDGVCGAGTYPLPHLPREASRSRANVAGGAFREARGYVPGPLLWNIWSRRTTRMYSEFGSYF